MSGCIELMTDRAKKVLAKANQHRMRLENDHIEPKHILMALVELNEVAPIDLIPIVEDCECVCERCGDLAFKIVDDNVVCADCCHVGLDAKIVDGVKEYPPV